MADPDRHIPEDAEEGAVPDPHRDEPDPAPDAHTRPEADAQAVRPDQQEELGPVEGLMHASAVEASTKASGSPEAHAEAERLGVEEEGVEAAQIFGLMLATAVTLGLAVFGVFFLVTDFTDEEQLERDAVVLYPELREVQRVAAEMENYSRTDSLYRLPIGAAMSQVADGYYTQQQDGDAVPAPANFSTLYFDALRESSVEGRAAQHVALGVDSLRRSEETVPSTGADLGTDTEEESGVEEGADTTPAPAPETPLPATDNEPEDR